MDRIAFDIYVPDVKKFRLTPNWIGFGLWMITIGIYWLFGLKGSDNTFALLLLLGTLAVTIYYLISSNWKYQPLNGRLEGKMILDENSLKINDQIFDLNDIDSLGFFFGDYYGKRSLYGRDLNPKLYQGVNNYISFTDKANQDHLVYFKLATEHSYLSFSSFINQAIRLKKMNVQSGIDLLGLENISIN